MTGEYKFEPSNTEILLTELFGNTVLRTYYKNFVKSLNIGKGDRILDYCSGSGIISKYIAKRLTESELTCADVSVKWLEHASNKLKSYHRVHGAKIKSFDGPIAAEKFDKAVVHFALHDFPKDYQLLVIEHIICNLKPEGILYIREPINPKHGIQLHEIVNIIEAAGKLSFEYKIEKNRLTGDYVDIKCCFKKIYYKIWKCDSIM